MTLSSFIKVSEVTTGNLGDFLRLTELTQSETQLLETIIESGKSYIKTYTGLTTEQLDLYPDITLALMVICQDMWDNRSYYVESNNVNKVVENILGSHSVNLL